MDTAAPEMTYKIVVEETLTCWHTFEVCGPSNICAAELKMHALRACGIREFQRAWRLLWLPRGDRLRLREIVGREKVCETAPLGCRLFLARHDLSSFLEPTLPYSEPN